MSEDDAREEYQEQLELALDALELQRQKYTTCSPHTFEAAAMIESMKYLTEKVRETLSKLQKVEEKGVTE
jgi:hypothetical protein